MVTILNPIFSLFCHFFIKNLIKNGRHFAQNQNCWNPLFANIDIHIFFSQTNFGVNLIMQGPKNAPACNNYLDPPLSPRRYGEVCGQKIFFLLFCYMLFPYVSSFQNVLNGLSRLSVWDFTDGNVRVCITGCREIYRKSPSFCRKGRQFLHAVAFFWLIGWSDWHQIWLGRRNYQYLCFQRFLGSIWSCRGPNSTPVYKNCLFEGYFLYLETSIPTLMFPSVKSQPRDVTEHTLETRNIGNNIQQKRTYFLNLGNPLSP